MCWGWGWGTNHVHKPASVTAQWEGQKGLLGRRAIMGQVSIPLALDLGEREGISFSLKSLCQGTELSSGYSGATSWHSRKGKHSPMLSRHVPLVLYTSDERYGKVQTSAGTIKVAGGKLGQEGAPGTAVTEVQPGALWGASASMPWLHPACLGIFLALPW